ncbi:MAG: HD domain-containing protein [Planctomycetaceae bacterium]|nr:HD domain-containing protein [Planctomycetaceae bacterium]
MNEPLAGAPAARNPSLGEVLCALSFALDWTSGEPAGHALRCAWLGARLGREVGLAQGEQQELVFGLLLKDAGCTANSERLGQWFGHEPYLVGRAVGRELPGGAAAGLGFLFGRGAGASGIGWRLGRLLALAFRGRAIGDGLAAARRAQAAAIAAELDLGPGGHDVQVGIDERWDGRGRPEGLAADSIPVGARIAALVQAVERRRECRGLKAALGLARAESGRRFDPSLVQKLVDLAEREDLLAGLAQDGLEERLLLLLPEAAQAGRRDAQFDTIARAFGRIIDNKSSYTAGHSERVAHYSLRIGEMLGLPRERLRWLARSASLHDLGKLAVSGAILDKPSALEPHEWESVRVHPTFTAAILERIDPFQKLSATTGALFEHLDGSGYPKGLKGQEIGLEARIVACAHIFDALRSDRPHRKAHTERRALGILQEMSGVEVDSRCLEGLILALEQDADGAPASEAA